MRSFLALSALFASAILGTAAALRSSNPTTLHHDDEEFVGPVSISIVITSFGFGISFVVWIVVTIVELVLRKTIAFLVINAITHYRFRSPSPSNSTSTTPPGTATEVPSPCSVLIPDPPTVLEELISVTYQPTATEDPSPCSVLVPDPPTFLEELISVTDQPTATEDPSTFSDDDESDFDDWYFNQSSSSISKSDEEIHELQGLMYVPSIICSFEVSDDREDKENDEWSLDYSESSTSESNDETDEHNTRTKELSWEEVELGQDPEVDVRVEQVHRYPRRIRKRPAYFHDEYEKYY